MAHHQVEHCGQHDQHGHHPQTLPQVAWPWPRHRVNQAPRPDKPEVLGQRRKHQNGHQKYPKRPGSSHAGGSQKRGAGESHGHYRLNW